MENFYSSNLPLLRANSAAVALRSICGRIQKQTMLLVLSMLLFSFSSFGQITSVRSGNWNEATTWSTGVVPVSTSNVTIKRDHTITVNNTVACSMLTVESAHDNGQKKGVGTLIIKSDQVLSIVSYSTEDNSQNNLAKAIVTIETGGELKVSGGDGLTQLTRAAYNFFPNSTVTYISGSGQTIANLNYKNLHLSGFGIKTPPATLTILENLTNFSTLNAGSSTINIGGNFTNSGTFNKGTASTVVYNGNTVGANQNVAGVAYHNLTFSGSSTKTAKGKIWVSNTVAANGGSFIPETHTFTYDGGNQTIAGLQYYNLEFTNSGTSEVNKTADGDIKVQNILSVISTSNVSTNVGFIASTYSVDYNGGTQNIAPLKYNNLILSGGTEATPGVKTASGTIRVASAFIIRPNATFAHNGQNFYYNGSNQFVTPAVYHHLSFAGLGAKLATSDLLIEGNLTLESDAKFGTDGLKDYSHTIKQDVINSGVINDNDESVTIANQLKVGRNFTNTGTFNGKHLTHTISGNWQSSYDFNAGSSTIILDGANTSVNPKTVSSTGTDSFYNLEVKGGDYNLASNITVNNTLRVENKILETDVNTLFLGPAANLLSEETATAHIKGTLQTNRNLELPNANVFGNIGIRITDFPSGINEITVKRVTGIAFKSNLTQKSSVLRQFHITTPTATKASLFNATIDMRFPAYELNEPEGTTYYDIYRENLDGSIEHLKKAETSDLHYNYKLSKADRKYGMYTISSNVSPLPVELTWFKAQRQSQGILLTWETASEQENKGFEVQVSTDGKSFNKVAFVDSKVVNSSVTQRYSYTDNATLSYGTRYYRLAQVDMDGTTTYSNIRAVNMDAAIVAAAAYPNPFAEGQQVTVRLPQGGESRQVRLVLTNTMGQVVLEQQAQVENGQVELSVNTTKANARGMYLLYVLDNGTKYTFKMIKQ